MEPNTNLQKMIAKKVWHMLRVAIFMLKKGMSKTKLLSDLNLMMKRGKIAGKAMHNLMFYNTHHIPTTSNISRTTTRRHLDEYEFSCSKTPTHPFHNMFKRKNHRMFSASYNQSPADEEDYEVMTENAVMKALEMLKSKTASPALITDSSPFPVNYYGNEDNHVDEAADEFIKKFYKNIRKQSSFGDAEIGVSNLRKSS